jgi:hypothetical protein
MDTHISFDLDWTNAAFRQSEKVAASISGRTKTGSSVA